MSRAEGTWGEALAAEYLQKHGYKLAAHGYQCRFGEIDLIAWDGDILCFVEVKTRTNIHRAQRLPLLVRRTAGVTLVIIIKGNAARSEIQLRSNTEGKILIQTHLSYHTNIETHVPIMLVSSNKRLHLRAVLHGYGLQTNVIKLQILHVGTHNNAEVERTQISIRAVLHPTLLRMKQRYRRHNRYK